MIGNLITDEEWNSDKTVNVSRLFEKKIGKNKDPRERDDIKDEIYKNFKVGNRLAYSDIKTCIVNIFGKYNISLSPTAAFITNYFGVKKVKISSKDNNKRANGYRLLSKLL